MSTIREPPTPVDRVDAARAPELDLPPTLPAGNGASNPSLRQHATTLPRIPGYEIMHVLGHGGMSKVYLASQTALKRRVAIKMIRREDWNDADQLHRFQREAESIASLQHQNIVQVFEVGEANGIPYLVLEYVSGGTLHRHIAGRPLEIKHAARIVQQLALGIQAAHDRQIIHRDLKPANVLLSFGNRQATVKLAAIAAKIEEHRTAESGPVPKITDFGLARHLADDQRQTQSGTALGTPSYMSPEQAVGKSSQVGKAADIYGLGTILYETLTGRPPFEGDTPLETVLLVRQEEPVPPSRLNRKVPRDLENICLKCLEKSPSRRYASAHDLAVDLERFLNGRPVKARPVGPLGRLLKWARRRPSGALAVVAGSLLFAGLVAYLVTVQSLYSQLKSSNEELKQKTKELEILTQKEKDHNRDLRDLLNSAELSPADARKLADNDPDDFKTQMRAFDALVNSKKLDQAQPYLDRSLHLAREAAKRSPESFEAWGELAAVHDRAGDVCKLLQDAKECRRQQDLSMHLREWLHERDPQTPRWRLEYVLSLLKTARWHLDRQTPEGDREAGIYLGRGVAVLTGASEPPEMMETLLEIRDLLADIWTREGDFTKAGEQAAEAEKIRVRLFQGRTKHFAPKQRMAD